MPNWVTNRIVLYGTEQKDINEVIDFLKGDNGDMDFNKIIPMPEELRSTSCGSVEDLAWDYFEITELRNEEAANDRLTWNRYKERNIFTKDQLLKYMEKEFQEVLEEECKYKNIIEYGKHLHNLHQKYGFHDWYEWSCKNWGTKWNACDAEREENVIKFETAWNNTGMLMLEVTKLFPEVTMGYEFADENFGYNLGRYTLKAGEIISEYEPEEDSAEAKILAKQILGWEPEEEFDLQDVA